MKRRKYEKFLIEGKQVVSYYYDDYESAYYFFDNQERVIASITSNQSKVKGTIKLWNKLANKFGDMEQGETK
jgi:hypothetical protein